MSDIIDTKNTNEWIDWIEVAIKNEYLKYYEIKILAILKKLALEISEKCTVRIGKILEIILC